MKRIMIGVTGFAGSGKSSVAEYLKSKGFDYYSVRTYIMAELNKRGLSPNRDNMAAVANEMRGRYGASYFMDLIAGDIGDSVSDVVFESVRNIGEVQYIKQLGGILLATEATLSARYDRICCRGSETDSISFEDFKRQEKVEMNSEDSAKQNMQAVIQMADIHIGNNADQSTLFKKVDALMDKMKKS